MEVLPFIIPMFLLPMIQELIHSLIIVGIRVSVFKLTSMMASVWIYHKPWMRPSHLFSNTPLP